MLRQGVGNLVPRCFRANKHMTCGPIAGIVIEDTERQTDFLRPGIELGEQVRTADRTKAPVLARGGLVKADEFFAPHPTQIRRLHPATCAKGRSMRLAAHAAVAEEHIPHGTIDFQRHTLAQATSMQSHSNPLPDAESSAETGNHHGIEQSSAVLHRAVRVVAVVPAHYPIAINPVKPRHALIQQFATSSSGLLSAVGAFSQEARRVARQGSIAFVSHACASLIKSARRVGSYRGRSNQASQSSGLWSMAREPSP